jgi:hypothetical protein
MKSNLPWALIFYLLGAPAALGHAQFVSPPSGLTPGDRQSSAAASEGIVAERNCWWKSNITSQLIPQVRKVSPLFAAFLDVHREYFLRREKAGPVPESYSLLLRGKFSGVGDQTELDWKLTVERGEHIPTTWTYWMSTHGEEANTLRITVNGDDVTWTVSRDEPVGSGAFHATTPAAAR